MTPPNATEVEVLVQRAAWIRALAQALVRDEHEAEDLAQDAWVVALTRHARTSDGWASWIGATMRNLARSRWRGDRRREARERDAARPEAEPSNAEMLEHLDAHEVLVRSVRALDEPYRTAILLRYFEDLSPREIAARERIPVKTIDTRLNRALAKLRVQLDRGQRGDRHAWLALLVPLVRPKHAVVAGVAAVSMKLKIAAAIVLVAGVIWWVRERQVARVEGNEPVEAASVQRELAAPSASPAPAADSSARTTVETPTETPSKLASSKAELKEKTATRIAGSVVDAGGRALAGLRVLARAGAWRDGQLVAEARTDAAGTFELELADGTERLDVDAPSWVIVLRPRISLSAGKPHVFVLAPLRHLAGTVVDQAGAALPGVELRIVPPPDLRTSIERVLDLSFNESWVASSDASGAFIFDAAPDLGGCELAAKAPGFDDARLALAAGDRLDLRVVLARHAEPAKHVVGRVVDARGGPIEGAYVAFTEMAGGDWDVHEAARTNARGEFDVPAMAVPDGPRKLTALATGFSPAEIASGWDEAARRITWPEPLEFVLDGTSLSITGRVLHEDGSPARGAIVANLDQTPFVSVPWSTSADGATFWASLSTEDLLRGPKVRDVYTDKQARFELGGLLDKPYRLRVFDPATLDVVFTQPITAGSHDVEIRLPSSATIDRIAGHVVDATGAPIPNVYVWAMRRTPGDGGEGSRMPALRSKAMTTDAVGAFEFRGLARAVDELRIQAADQPTTVTFRLAEFEDLERVVLTLERTCNFKIDLSGSTLAAASMRVLDSTGVELTISESRGKMTSAASFVPLESHGTGTLLVSDRAAVLVFFDANGIEIARMPLALKAGELTVVRP